MATIQCLKCAGTGKYGYRFECFRCHGLGVIPAKAVVAVAKSASVNVDKIVEALNTAAKNGLQFPKVRAGEYFFSLAGKDSKNPGAIYIKVNKEYFGKIHHGQFTPSAACTDQRFKEIVEILADPMQAAIAHGRKTGQCAICGLTLTNKASIARGIGPICASKYGWAEIFSAEEIENDVPSVEIPDELDLFPANAASILGVK